MRPCRWQWVRVVLRPWADRVMTSIVLAGGASSRLGFGKALEVLNGKSLVQWVVERLAVLSREIIVVASGRDCPDELRGALDPGLGLQLAAVRCPKSVAVKMVVDIYPSVGALVGIYSGLAASSASRAIVVGCDMPFLNAGLLGYMVELSSAFDVVVPRTAKGVEPLCAVYSKSCLGSINSLLQRNELRIGELLNMVKVRYVDEDEIAKFDREHLSFFNINTRAELAKARKLAVGRGWQHTASD